MIQNVQAYVPSWPGPKQHAQSTAEIIQPFCPVTILDNPDDYFNAQFDKAKRRFLNIRWNWNEDSLKESAMLWVMADVWPPQDFAGMFAAGCAALSRPDVGWYAPDVEWTGYIYDKKDLNELTPGVFEVPNTDSLCCMIRGDVVAQMPFIDPEVSYVWGMDFIAIATARLMGLTAVRDYRFKAEHPNDTRYDIDKASQSMKPLFAGLKPELRAEIEFLMRETSRLRRKPQQAVNAINPPHGLTELEKNQLESARRHRDAHTNNQFAK